ncbi:MAG: subclass B1 metallo-beta-lactamase [Imperialibacter sp.]|uniref:subclass B1 metallo-beta-lactamase n=1 Tax=Imperialibacter sp. TaxID=2038411 RepID=UPI0032EBBCA7
MITNCLSTGIRKFLLLPAALLCIGTANAQFQIEVKKHSSSIYIYESYGAYQGGKVGANAVIFVGKDSVVVIDTPWGNDQTIQLLDWIDREIKKPVASFVITHFHDDRIGGIAVLKERGIPAVSSELTAKLAVENGIAMPDVLFKNDTTIALAGGKIEVFYPGAGHSPDNVVVYFPSEKLLYGGCFLKDASTTSLGNLGDADVAAWPVSLEKMKKRFPKPKMVIPGHGGLEPGAIENTAKLLEDKKD